MLYMIMMIFCDNERVLVGKLDPGEPAVHDDPRDSVGFILVHTSGLNSTECHRLCLRRHHHARHCTFFFAFCRFLLYTAARA